MSLSNTYQGGGLDADHTYACAYCGADNSLFVEAGSTWLFEPNGSQRQLLTQECEACLETNDLTITLTREGSVRIRAEKHQQLEMEEIDFDF